VPTGTEAAEQVGEMLRRGRTRPSRTAITAAELAHFAETAAALRPVFVAVQDGDLDRAADQVNRLMTRWSAQPSLTRHDGEPWHLHFHRPDAEFAAGWAAGLA